MRRLTGAHVQNTNRCWARALGGCAGGISREHTVSDSLFTGSSVTVMGGPWAAGIPRVIGRNRLRRRILCRRHNSLLSPVDNEGGRAFRSIGDLDTWLARSRRTGLQQRREYTVQGPLLERWFLKTTVNLFVVSRNARTWFDGAQADTPPTEIVRAVFGTDRLRHPVGLYNWGGFTPGEQVTLRSELQFSPYFREQSLVGAHFVFHGLNFLIWLVETPPPWPQVRDFYRHVGGEFNDGPNSADLTIVWPVGWRQEQPAVLVV